MDETDNVAKFTVTGDDGGTFHVLEDYGRVRKCLVYQILHVDNNPDLHCCIHTNSQTFL